MTDPATDELPQALREWVLRSGVLRSGNVTAIVDVASMAQSGTGGPWLLTVDDGVDASALVLKAEPPGPDAGPRFATAAAALDVAAASGVPAPRPVAHDLDAASGWFASLTTALPGSSSIAAGISRTRLRTLGAEAARIHLVAGDPTHELPWRRRSLDGYDLDAGSAPTRSTPLLDEARRVLADRPAQPDEPTGFVHGDLWQGNTLWEGERYTGAVDWDFAGFGPAGIDLGSLRADVAVLHGQDAADEVLAGWEEAAGRAASRLPWWDLVAGLSTPDDLNGWLPNFHAQGRTDLDLATITDRRDAFVERALRELR